MEKLLDNIRKCTLCKKHLKCGPRPIVQANPKARILIIGQAPGVRVHNSGIPWDDRSGDRMREWLQLDKATFYNPSNIAIVPIGFCFPGTDKNGGDKPPRKECAPKWHPQILSLLSNIQITLLVGSYAQQYYLKEAMKNTMNETVRAWRQYLPDFFPLPHPSWRNTGWLKQNSWFHEELLPDLQHRIKKIMKEEN